MLQDDASIILRSAVADIQASLMASVMGYHNRLDNLHPFQDGHLL